MNQVHIPEGDPNRPVRNITWKEANEAERRREGKIALGTYRARARRGVITEGYTRFQRVLASSVEGAGRGIGWILQWPRKARLGERI